MRLAQNIRVNSKKTQFVPGQRAWGTAVELYASFSDRVMGLNDFYRLVRSTGWRKALRLRKSCQRMSTFRELCVCCGKHGRFIPVKHSGRSRKWAVK